MIDEPPVILNALLSDHHFSSSRWYKSSLDFYEDRLAVNFSDPDIQNVEILYSEIKRVQINPAKHFVGFRINHTVLSLNKTQRDYYSAPTPWMCEISQFDVKHWPQILQLIQVHAPDAVFND